MLDVSCLRWEPLYDMLVHNTYLQVCRRAHELRLRPESITPKPSISPSGQAPAAADCANPVQAHFQQSTRQLIRCARKFFTPRCAAGPR